MMPSTQSSSRRLGTVVCIMLSTLVLALLSTNVLSSWTTPRLHYEQDASFKPLKEARANAGDQYLLGVGKADITGPVVEVNFMGYADLSQVGTGLRQRIFARAFIIGSTSNDNDRFVYLNLDTQSGDTAIRNGILEGLAALGSDYASYSTQNVAVVGTHQHSGPGAWLNYLLPQVTSLGFDPQSYQAIVNGSVLAIQRAHESLTPGYLDVAQTNVTDANINRSPYAYLANPAEERANYTSDTEQFMTMMRFQRASDSKNMGFLAWFPVHGTSAYENNTHVTGDNKGVAAYLFEQAIANDTSAADGFVAGFSQASVGDTTPNVLGAWCDDGSGQMCDFATSTCGGTTENCHGRGPFFQNLDLGISSCYEIGQRQFSPAMSLYEQFDNVATPISDPSVKAFHIFNDMRYFQFELPNGTAVQTCPAALGYSFAAGTSDGPGAFDFTQGVNGSDADPLWNVVSDLLKAPGPEQIACQQPKPILLDAGEQTVPYAWAPNIVDMQLLRVGQLIVVVSPSEVTTMSGRRWKNAVAQAAVSEGIVTSDPIVVLGSPANTYAHYLTTPEEYGIQRYEGASTLFGQWELPAYINLTVGNIGYLAANASYPTDTGPLPPDNRNVSLDFITPVVFDGTNLGSHFGDVSTQPNAAYNIGDVVNASFVGANPRNNLRLEGTFAAVEQQQGSTWVQVRDDWDWHLEYTWVRDSTILGTSTVTISWETESYAQPGTYRIHYYGDAKSLLGGAISSFEGISNSFTLS